MNGKEFLENKIVCLKQLRLSKWQLIWNKEVELAYILKIEQPAVDEVELKGSFDPEHLSKIKSVVKQNMSMVSAEIQQAQLYINMLDEIIADLEKQ